MGLLSKLFGTGTRCAELLEKGAMIVDVRSKGEYDAGHVPGSINMPLDSFDQKTGKLKKMNKPVVLCCASGARSGIATRILKRHGIECCNGGNWHSVSRKLKTH